LLQKYGKNLNKPGLGSFFSFEKLVFSKKTEEN